MIISMRLWRQRREGFTTIELAMVLVVMALVMAIALPRFQNIRTRAGVRSARQQVISSVATARAAAIRRGRSARLNVSADTIWVTIDSSGTWVPLTSKVPLASLFQVQLSSSSSSITFDARGIATGLGGNATFAVTHGSVTDSVCITKVGAVLWGGCGI
jgi:Tfp pilus assembly protein FimT